jgi:hypothetical protein
VKRRGGAKQKGKRTDFVTEGHGALDSLGLLFLGSGGVGLAVDLTLSAETGLLSDGNGANVLIVPEFLDLL